MVEEKRARGAVVGSAIGDALGMPLEGMSHQNVRTYYKGVKGFRRDEKRNDLDAGQWTARTQCLLLLSDILADEDQFAAAFVQATRDAALRRAPDDGAATGWTVAAATAVGLAWAAYDWQSELALSVIHDAFGEWRSVPGARSAAFGQAAAVRQATVLTPKTIDGATFLEAVREAVAWAEDRFAEPPAVSARLDRVRTALEYFPLDLQDLCGGTGASPDEAWPFAVAMFARNPLLVQATLLSAVNVGGDAPTIGACLGGLLGALHGEDGFPTDWIDALEDHAGLRAAADRFAVKRS